MAILLSSVFLIQFGFVISLENPFSVYVETTGKGTYTIKSNSKTWLTSGPTFFNADNIMWTTNNASQNQLQISHMNASSGSDKIGHYNETSYTATAGKNATKISISIRAYTDKPVIIFSQEYENGSKNTSLGDFNATIGGFPCFNVKNSDIDLAFLNFGGFMFGYTDMGVGRWINSTANIVDGIIGGPLAIFDNTGNTLVISPFDNFMAASSWHREKPGGHVCWGIMGGVNSIPLGFIYQTIIVYGNGINKAFNTWGSILRQYYDTDNSRYEHQARDLSLNYLGYWTDNGAYYYYNTLQNKTYEETLMQVKKYAENANIPYRYLQLDSWWYPKDELNAVITWTPMKSVFPRGISDTALQPNKASVTYIVCFTNISFLQSETNWPFVAHNRYWSRKTTYAKENNGTYTFVIGQYGSLPNDQAFWNDLLTDAKKWGLIVYEQDWLNVQFGYLRALQTSLTLGHDWLTQMGNGALNNNLTIQYCMANPRHALQSLTIPPVTQARVSMDYFLGPEQWRIGVTSIFANALNVLPYKDTFWTTSYQPGNPYNKSEHYPALQSLVSSLSAGPIGPGDAINMTNRELLMRCCRQDGLILKPGRPATAIDKQMIEGAYNGSLRSAGEVWSTSCILNAIGNTAEYGILFAADLQRNIKVSIKDLRFSSKLFSGIYFPYNNLQNWQFFNVSTMIELRNCTKLDFCLYYFSPLVNTAEITAIFGEDGKWITMSNNRVLKIDQGSSLSLTLSGVRDENVKFNFLQGSSFKSVNCTFPFNGKVIMDLNNGRCAFHPEPTTSPPRTTGTSSISPNNSRKTEFSSRMIIVSLLFFLTNVILFI